MKRRQTPRKQLAFYLTVSRKDGEDLGHLVDISEGGFQIMRESPLGTGQTYSVRIYHPEQPENRVDLVLQAKSLWCRKSYNPDLYDVGFLLLDPQPQQLAEIRALVKLLGYHDNGM